MRDSREDGDLLQALRHEVIPPSTMDIRDLVVRGRKRVRTRRRLAIAAVATVAAIAIAIPFLPNTPPEIPVVPVIPPTSCTVQVLPSPTGFDQVWIIGSDSSGRYLYGAGRKGMQETAVVWDNGVLIAVNPPVHNGEVVVNAHGVIAGFGEDGAFVYRDGKYTLLAQPNGFTFRPKAINDRGEILGTRSGNGASAVVWGLDGRIKRTTDKPIVARGLDIDGTVIGTTAQLANGTPHGLIWREGEGVTDVPLPRGAAQIAPMAMRNGWIVGVEGYLKHDSPPLKLWLWNVHNGQTVELPSEFVSSVAVNAHGWAGANNQLGEIGENGMRPALFAAGKVIRLPEPPGAEISDQISVEAISDDGRTLGGSITYSDATPGTALLWRCR